MNWINVNDQLPAINALVILYSGRITCGWLVADGDPLFFSCEFQSYEDGVTYWTQLPNPPTNLIYPIKPN